MTNTNVETTVQNSIGGYLRRKSLRAFLGGCETPLAESSLDYLIKNANFPRPIFLSSRIPVWSIKEVEQWLQNRRKNNTVTLGEI